MTQPDIGKLANDLYQMLKDNEPDERSKIINAALTLWGDSDQNNENEHKHEPSNVVSREPSFLQREDLSPKQFLHEKSPTTDIDRVTCIAYYLTHYRDMPYFKSFDIATINTEAAQLKFNITRALDNAATKGLLAPSIKGKKQISMIGEKYVEALPNLVAAKAVFAKMKPKRKRTKKKKTKK